METEKLMSVTKEGWGILNLTDKIVISKYFPFFGKLVSHKCGITNSETIIHVFSGANVVSVRNTSDSMAHK
jgi:hypothetical protein